MSLFSVGVARTGLSEKDQQAVRIRRFLIGTAAYVLAICAAGLGTWMAFWDSSVLAAFVLIVAAINILFYAAFVSGLNRKMNDPSLTEMQIMAGVCALLFIVYHAGPARGIALLWVLMIFMFGVFRLNTVQLWRLAAVTWIAYSLIIYLDLQYHSGSFDLKLEIYQWLVLGVVLAWFAFMGGYVSALRTRTRKSEAFYRALWETVNDAVLIVNAGGQIDYANPAVAPVFGRSPDALSGKAVLPLMASGAREGRSETFDQFMVACKPPHGGWNLIEMRFVHADGHEFPAEVSAAEMQVENQRVFLMFVRDITARKQTEAALEAAREAAEASSQAKSQFMANMSHEVRTPMNGMMGMAEILLHDTLTPKQRDYVETIHRSGQSLMGVLNDVLDFARIESGRIELEHKAFDLPLAVRDTAKLFETAAGTKSLQLVVTLDPALPHHVMGDVVRVRQVLNNLVANAVEFTGQGRIDIHVSHVTNAAQPSVRFDVRDTGIGIAAEQHARIFEAFTQVDGSLTRSHGGSGLGLAIAQGLIVLMKGECGLESTPGVGSHFWFTVPLPGASPAQAASARRAALSLYPGKRVLLVEDDALNAKIASLLLVQRGITVMHAVNGKVGVEDFEAHGEAGIDLVLMDCQMPVMDGFEATHRIRALEQARGWRRTPVSAFTAHAFDGYRDECLAAGMDDYISKPVNLPAFEALLGRWLGGARPA